MKEKNIMKSRRVITPLTVLGILFTLVPIQPNSAIAHCDGLDGPVVKAAQKALETGNVNLVLSWVQKDDEAEIRKAFQKTIAVRKLSPEAKELDETKPPTIPPIVAGDSIQDEIQALVIGDALVLAVGCMEAYVEIGLNIKEASPFKHTFTLAYANGPWLGYLPSPHRYAVNDPDAKTTPFAPDAPHVLVEEALRLVNKQWSMVIVDG
jgi:hypothetical protein